jgi:hypothetical protein
MSHDPKDTLSGLDVSLITVDEDGRVVISDPAILDLVTGAVGAVAAQSALDTNIIFCPTNPMCNLNTGCKPKRS